MGAKTKVHKIKKETSASMPFCGLPCHRPVFVAEATRPATEDLFRVGRILLILVNRTGSKGTEPNTTTVIEDTQCLEIV
jgi:hypothetical protein